MASRADNILVPDLRGRAPLDANDADIIINQFITEGIARDREHPHKTQGDLRDFLFTVRSAMLSRQEWEDVPSDKRLDFLEDDPPEKLNTPSITFFLKARKPGQFSRGPAGSGGTREVTPHLRSEQQHPDNPGEKLVTTGMFHDNWLTFNVYARTSKVAFNNLLWFERVMRDYRWWFRLNGFQVIPEGVGTRERVEIKDGDKIIKVTKYPMSYMVRTDDVSHFSTQEFRRLIIDVGVARDRAGTMLDATDIKQIKEGVQDGHTR
jgi:hypothetical protein